MAYYLAVETTQGSFEAINFKKTRKFKKIIGDQEGYECTLEEINKFTTCFTDDQHLNNELNGEKVLAWVHYKHPLSIIYVNNPEVRKVQGNILYSDSKVFIENPELVIDYIVKKAKENDYLFFRKLSSTLPETSIITCMTSKLATAIDGEIKQKNILQTSEAIENLAFDIARSLVQHCYINENGELIFSDVINYEQFHGTVSFISDYENELTRNKTSNYTRSRQKPQ